MKAQFKPKSWYIQLIHVAKGQLAIDDQSYRANLQSITGKTSCSNMNISELFQILEFLKSKGFKPKAKKSYSPKTSNKSTHTQLDKLRQLWIHMSHQGFLNDGSEQALAKWAANQSKILNKGEPITKLEWLKGNMLHTLIEQLKRWHFRLLENALPPIYKSVIELNQEDLLSNNHSERIIEMVQNLNDNPVYQTMNDAYITCQTVINEHQATINKDSK